ncbi:MAG: PilZ domain-containing protein [bacterium]|nr:PilZ domain-containing protein [bacterium]
MEISDRKESREETHPHILLQDNNKKYPATVIDISKSGMSVRTSHMFPTYKEIDVLIKIRQKVVPLKGCVRWVNAGSDTSEEYSHSVGIMFQNPPEEYISHFEEAATRQG